MGFQGSFEGREGGGISDGLGEFIPECGAGYRESPVTPGLLLCLGDLKEAILTGPEGACWGIRFEEVGEVGGSQVVKSLVGGEE